jgi:hypothetical protein
MRKTLLIASLALTLDAGAQAQIRRQPAQPETVPLEIALEIGSRRYDFTGQGECKAAPQASIHGVPAALYSVAQSAGGQSLNLTLWQPKDGAPAMMTLLITSASKRIEVDTVKGGTRRDLKGSGTVTLQRSGEGGLFTVAALAGSGEKVNGKIRCGRFGGIRAEGG